MSYEYLAHHGILGQKWGVRRFQNRDGSYTAEGRKRHAEYESEYEVQYNRNGAYAANKETGKKMSRKLKREIEKDMRTNDEKLYKEYKYNKKLANTSASYIGNNTSMAVMTMALNNASAGTRDIGKKRVAEILSEYGITYVNKINTNNQT